MIDVKKVLIIDDHPDDAFVSSILFKKEFPTTEIRIEHQASEALEFLSNSTLNNSVLPEIILLDINMPLMNGFDFLKEFDKLDNDIKMKCKIFMLTSSNDEKDKEKAFESEYVFGYILKPLNLANIKKQFNKE